jgi:hypothetical protein
MNNIPHIIDTGASVMNNKPVAWMEYIQGEEWEVWFVEPTDLPKGHTYKPLYTHPVKELTDEEINIVAILQDAEIVPVGHEIWKTDEEFNKYKKIVLATAKALRKAQE